MRRGFDVLGKPREMVVGEELVIYVWALMSVCGGSIAYVSTAMSGVYTAWVGSGGRSRGGYARPLV